MGAPTDAPPGSTGPPDRQTLRLIERTLASESLVDRTAFNPDATDPQFLRISLDAESYGPAIQAARLDVRWFTSGDFAFHYVEGPDSANRWECRWDRHPNPHNTRLHFHEPPDGHNVSDLSLDSTHPLDVSFTVLGAIERRVTQSWESDEN